MIISFDAQPLLDDQKTGIGFYEDGITKALISLCPANNYRFDFFSFRHHEEKERRMASFRKAGGEFNKCIWFPPRIYRLLWNFLPVPYSLFFGRSAQITHFFNYHVPPGVHGKRVATVHDMAYKVFPETVRLKTKIMLNLSLTRSVRRAHHLLTDSQFSKAEIIRFLKVPPEKITVVPCGVDTQVFHPVSDPAQTEATRREYAIPTPYFLYLGTLEPRKNIERLIEAYAALKAARPDAPALVLAGRKGWLYDTIFARVKELHLEDHVLFTGYVANEDAPILLSGATAFLFPSLYEGFGMPPLEAMACGTPVLTANVSSLPEVVGDCAVLVDPYSVEEIRAGMERLMDDGDLRADLSARGLARAKTFTWERSAEIVMDVYKQLVEQDD